MSPGDKPDNAGAVEEMDRVAAEMIEKNHQSVSGSTMLKVKLERICRKTGVGDTTCSINFMPGRPWLTIYQLYSQLAEHIFKLYKMSSAA